MKYISNCSWLSFGVCFLCLGISIIIITLGSIHKSDNIRIYGNITHIETIECDTNICDTLITLKCAHYTEGIRIGQIMELVENKYGLIGSSYFIIFGTTSMIIMFMGLITCLYSLYRDYKNEDY